jgi:hypothetical protein
MKKITLLCLVLVMLAVSVVPVMAAKGGNNGHGNEQNEGQGNGRGNQDQDRNQDGDKNAYNGSGVNGNQEHMHKRTPFYLQGTISALDAGAGSITVTLTHGNAKVKAYIGADLTLQTSEGTLIFQITQGDENSENLNSDMSGVDDSDDDGSPSNRIPITFDQLTVGQKVAIHGNLVDTVYTARLITVYIRELVEP